MLLIIFSGEKQRYFLLRKQISDEENNKAKIMRLLTFICAYKRIYAANKLVSDAE